jgi:DnaJ-class molecular chaperone
METKAKLIDGFYCEHKSNPKYCPYCTTEEQREVTRRETIECPHCIDGIDFDDMPCIMCEGSSVLSEERSINLHNVRFLYWAKKAERQSNNLTRLLNRLKW